MTSSSSSSDNGPVSSSPGSCPVRSGAGGNNTATSSWWGSKHSTIPASVEEAAKHSQSPHPDQPIPLSTTRMISSIPRADELRPVEDVSQLPKPAPHQPPTASNWVYPSEQQFYNAMRRKGYKIEDMTAMTTSGGTNQQPDSPLEVIPYIVRIHNAVNERCWMEICRWERELHGNEQPRLIRFLGRPNDLSPKAWFNSRILFKKGPFDRHDWFIDRGDGKGERRYVIDFYNGQEEKEEQDQSNTRDFKTINSFSDLSHWFGFNKSTTTNTSPPMPELPLSLSRPSMYVDVRPALDTPDALVDRVQMFVRDAFPRIVRWTFTAKSPPLQESPSTPSSPSSSQSRHH